MAGTIGYLTAAAGLKSPQRKWYRFVPLAQAYIVTMRPYLMFVSGITGISGLSLVEGVASFRALLVAAASFLSYGFGQALTDCFQMDTDLLSSPYRPLVRGTIRRPVVLTVSILGLTVCVLLFGATYLPNILLGVAGGLGLATYTPFKRRWWGGPFYNAWIVALLCLMAYLAPGEIHNQVMTVRLVWVLICVFFGYANFVLTGYFKDIAADRATGYVTLPVRFGRPVSVIVSDIFSVLALCSGSIALFREVPFITVVTTYPMAFSFWFLGVAMLLYGQLRLHDVRTDEEAHIGIVPGLHAYILLLSAIAAIHRPDWSLPLILFYGMFVLVLHRRPMEGQI